MNLISKTHIKEVEESIGYTFKDKKLLITALCHRSFAHENQEININNNERLEFLGDALLQLTIAHLIMDIFPDYTEGELSKLRAGIVNETQLSDIAMDLKLGAYILLGKGEEYSNGRGKNSILSDTYEAILGAVYKDAGYDNTCKIVAHHFNNILYSPEAIHNDYKTDLQELTQKMFQEIPEYILEQEAGPPHDKTFTVRLMLAGESMALGLGKNKKSAQQDAAKITYNILSAQNTKDAHV